VPETTGFSIEPVASGLCTGEIVSLQNSEREAKSWGAFPPWSVSRERKRNVWWSVDVSIWRTSDIQQISRSTNSHILRGTTKTATYIRLE